MIEAFIEENRKLWAELKPRRDGKKLLIEEPHHPSHAHGNAVFALVLNQAIGLVPVWLDDGRGQSIDWMRSYFPNAQTLLSKQRSWWNKAAAMAEAAWHFLPIVFSRDILGFYYDGVKYGDVVYDAYLAFYECGTIRAINYQLIRVIASLILRHREIKKILLTGEYGAVLVNHLVGIDGAVVMRLAIKMGLPGYLRMQLLQKFSEFQDVYKFEFKPYPADIDKILGRIGPQLSRVFNEIQDKQTSGKGLRAATDAFSKTNKLYESRIDFIRDFGLDENKKTVFVMLHALNDQPHSHFGKMVFKDYYDWMAKTLAFAKHHPEVNWVFKQHPSIRYYVLKDLDFDEFFENLPPHVKYINEKKKLDTRSLITCADLVVTCAGSAGYELPAMGGIPSLTAGRTFYDGLGFSLDARTEQEYFDFLSQAPTLPKLTPAQQDRAKAAYIYILEISLFDSKLLPRLTWEEESDRNIQAWYWDRLAGIYREYHGQMLRDMDFFITTVARPGFKRFDSLEYFCQLHNL